MPFTQQQIAPLLGWRGDFPTRPAVARQFRRLKDVAPALMTGAPPASTMLYKAWKEALGDYPPYVAQEIGDCVSFGNSHVIDLLQAVQLVIGKQAIVPKEICTEALYGMAREEAGMLGGQDGCYGAAAAKAVLKGVVPRESVGPYDGKRAKAWGAKGTPADVKAEAKDHPIKATALVDTIDEAQASLANGYPIAVCSSQGFTMTRDSNGCCKASGTWNHCMCIMGYRTRSGQLEFLICQSWGPTTPDGPLADDQPSFSFWIADETMSKMLGAKDSFALSSFEGFPGQPLPASWSYSSFI